MQQTVNSASNQSDDFNNLNVGMSSLSQISQAVIRNRETRFAIVHQSLNLEIDDQEEEAEEVAATNVREIMMKYGNK